MLYAFFFSSQPALLSLIGTNIAASKSLCLEYVESQIVEVSRCFVIVVDIVFCGVLRYHSSVLR